MKIRYLLNHGAELFIQRGILPCKSDDDCHRVCGDAVLQAVHGCANVDHDWPSGGIADEGFRQQWRRGQFKPRAVDGKVDLVDNSNSVCRANSG